MQLFHLKNLTSVMRKWVNAFFNGGGKVFIGIVGYVDISTNNRETYMVL